MQKKRILIILLVVALGALAAVVISMRQPTEPETESAQSTAALPEPQSSTPKGDTVANPDAPVRSQPRTARGRYAAYSPQSRAEAGYDTTVVFFFASWCPECRAFKTAIQSGQLPEGVQILEADFDKSTHLKQQYGVTLQSTFVKVSPDGTQQSKWVGYGKEKTLQTVLNNLN